jgi:hypothetical protein
MNTRIGANPFTLMGRVSEAAIVQPRDIIHHCR